ncbi:MAG: NTP transferase domain-containing protein [Parcubacteria group bacterium]|nr:NTP transferase domain-containing protein [Parcubacteria group bacterium]
MEGGIETMRKRVKVIAAIQVSTKSLRLPGKAFKDLCGKPVLMRIIERLRKAKEVDGIVIATTTRPEDDVLVGFAAEHGVGCVRGEVTDVVGRLLAAMRLAGADAVLRVTGDSPMVDPDLVDRVIGRYRTLAGRVSFVTTCLPPTYPEGYSLEVLPTSLLEHLDVTQHTPEERETFAIHISKNTGMYSRSVVSSSKDASHFRLTLDYPDDFRVIEAVYRHFLGIGKEDFTVDEAVAFLEAHPEIASINQRFIDREKYPYSLGDAAVKKAL